jgi:hypothetical protein
VGRLDGKLALITGGAMITAHTLSVDGGMSG